jgi:hypothetical protein
VSCLPIPAVVVGYWVRVRDSSTNKPISILTPVSTLTHPCCCGHATHPPLLCIVENSLKIDSLINKPFTLLTHPCCYLERQGTGLIGLHTHIHQSSEAPAASYTSIQYDSRKRLLLAVCYWNGGASMLAALPVALLHTATTKVQTMREHARDDPTCSLLPQTPPWLFPELGPCGICWAVRAPSLLAPCSPFSVTTQ